jgi:GT2 family glycosyltransferase
MQTALKKANNFLRKGEYESAIKLLERVQEETPELRRYIELSIRLAERRSIAFFNASLNIKEEQRAAFSTRAQQTELEKPDDLDDYFFDLIKTSGLFDQSWYLDQYRDKYGIIGNPLSHYLTHGVALSTNPSPGFDTAYYLASYSDVAESNHQPLLHFLEWGIKEGRRPLPPNDGDQPPQRLGLMRITGTHQIVWDARISSWVSEGTDPHFFLEIGALANTEWAILHVAINGPHRTFKSKIYFDYGNGFNENDVFRFSLKKGEIASRVVRMKSPLRSLRFDPFEWLGAFYIPIFNIVPIDEAQAVAHMRRWLARYTRTSPGAAMVRDLDADMPSMSVEALTLEYLQAINDTDYAYWIHAIENPSLPNDDQVAGALAGWPIKPLISIIMPVYETPEVYLRRCIESVRAQSYPNWELCIADDCSRQPHVRRVLQEYERTDTRIRVVYRAENGHISRASNSALEIAQGEFVALLDHDDELPKDALYFVVEAINKHPSAKILYSDEDKIDKDGRRFDPHFKSDWNPDLFFSHNYITHLCVFRRELLMSIGGFRTGVEGSQDYDLILRCLPHVRNDQIVHIPRVLYHWRAIEGSTALASSEKGYTTEAGIKALKDYFEENGLIGVQVGVGWSDNFYRVRWPIPEPAPLVSLLIPTRDKKEVTEVAVRSILEKTTYPSYEIIILDNGSVEPETLQWFTAIQQEDQRVRVIRYDHPFNYSAINNFGVLHAKGSLIGLINNDVEVISPDWLTEMVSHAVREDIGCVGAKLYYSNETIQHGGVIIGLGGLAAHSHRHFGRNHPGYFARLMVVQNLSAVTGACLIVRKSVYDEVGGLDEVNLKVAFNDVDFCLKVREAGYRNLWTPYAELYHHESISRGYEDTPEKQERYRREFEFMKTKWGDVLERDPYYNPNLTMDREDFSISEGAT